MGKVERKLFPFAYIIRIVKVQLNKDNESYWYFNNKTRLKK